LKPSRRVAITGAGVVSAVGGDAPAFFAGLIAGRSGVRPLPYAPDVVAASVNFEGEAHFDRMSLATLDRFAQFALVASTEAVAQAGLEPADFQAARCGVYFGSGLGGAGTLERSYRAFLTGDGRVSPMTVILTMANAAAAHVALRHRIHGPTLSYTVACASAAVAIGEAFRAIRDGYLDLAIVGGSEALLVPGGVAGWRAMRVLAKVDPMNPEASCRPFGARRTGLVLGEGAGVLVLEASELAAARGKPALAELAGYGVTTDATHLTKPDPDGQAAAMLAALEDAGLDATSIGYLNAHGTATDVGDIVETQSIRAAFGPHADRLPVSSTKALHGHLLGASGAVELIAALFALRTGTLPPTCHLDVKDPRCDLDYVPNTARHGEPLEAVMSNSFAFGGTNAVLVARRC
jgi:3-oxoacyl-(acyl-carrier-protein) synthase